MSHGSNLHKTTTNIATKTMCYFKPNRHDTTLCKYMLQRCANFKSIVIPGIDYTND